MCNLIYKQKQGVNSQDIQINSREQPRREGKKQKQEGGQTVWKLVIHVAILCKVHFLVQRRANKAKRAKTVMSSALKDNI